MNTTKIGDKFRDDVANLLRSGGYNVQSEILDGHKRVDLFFEESRFGKRRRYAVEAKNWQRSLDHSDLEAIYGGYASLLQTHAIDELIVVSPHRITSAAANAFIKQTPGFSHQTFNEFQESILSFRYYLGSFIHRYEEAGLESYFIPPRLHGGADLEDHIQKWIDGDSNSPIAIIAGYGMGKTSFARHMAYKLAKRYLYGENTRLPILVSLGGISREQGLEGLIGTVLTAETPAVQNYSFPIFEHLNRMGRFLVILDGFDEMKHMMTESEFRATFDELNRLVKGSARVILLGRPSAFLSENEYAYVLRGVQRIGSQMHQSPGAPQYQELRLEPFSPTQVRAFVDGYIHHLAQTEQIAASDEFLERRRQELQSTEHEELISRPVHARMLADLATDPSFEISKLTRFQLYDHFVNHLIEREMRKAGRGNILKRQDRRDFSCDLSWHLWATSFASGLACRLGDLPDELFSPYLPSGEDLSALRRSLLSGSFMDEKSGGIFYFAHRSFQEFLVAEFIWSALSTEAENNHDIVEAMGRSLTPEVFNFLIERDDRPFFRSLLSALSNYRMGLPIDLLLILSRSAVLREIAAGRSSSFFTAWDAGMLIAYGLTQAPNLQEADIIRVCKQVGDRAVLKPGVILSAVKTVLLLANRLKISKDIIGPGLAALLFARAEQDIEALANESSRHSRSDTLRDLIFETVSAEETPDGDLVMSLDMETLFESVVDIAVQPVAADFVGRDTYITTLPIYKAPFSEFFRTVEPIAQVRLRAFFRQDGRIAVRLR